MKIVIIDDHPLVRRGLSSILALEPDNKLVGEAENVKQAIKLIQRAGPDIALIDLKLKNESGLDIVTKLKSSGSRCKFIILTSSASVDDFKQAEDAGVEGYVLKEALPDELLYVVRLVSQGRKYYDPGMMDLLINGKARDDYVEKLTPREKDVLEALGKGMKNSDIARKLFITEHTVKKHVSQILDKLDLADRTQAALYANNSLVK